MSCMQVMFEEDKGRRDWTEKRNESSKQANKTGEKAREQVPYQSAEESPISKAC